MNTINIIKALENEPNFVGVFARDQLPRKTAKPAGLVINTDKISDAGTHWVAYYISAGGQAEYFDPLGEKVPNNEIKSFVMRNSQQTTFQNLAYQSESSQMCGQFCVFFLRNRLNGRSSCEIHAMLSRNPVVNDSIV